MEQSKEWEVHFTRVTIKMSDGSAFTGRSTFAPSRGFLILSAADDRFIVLLSEEGQAQRVLMLNKTYIVWAEAVD